jgi:flagellar biosynthesis protein FliQ
MKQALLFVPKLVVVTAVLAPLALVVGVMELLLLPFRGRR